MPLGTRGTMDARFPWYGRTPAVGAMLGHAQIRHISNDPAWDTTWAPLDGTAANSPHLSPVVWTGRARIQPNVDWRARKHAVVGEVVTEHAVRIQIPFDGNTLPGHEGEMPLIGSGDWVTVTDVMSMQGVPSDDAVTRFTYTIRNIIGSSNSWTKTLLCDIIVNSQTVAP